MLNYLKAIMAKSFESFWTIFAIVLSLVSLFGVLYFENNATMLEMAALLGISTLIVILFRVVFIAPYQLWLELTQNLIECSNSVRSPQDSASLYRAATLAYSAAKKVRNSWSVSAKENSAEIIREYASARETLSNLGDLFLADKKTFALVQDLMNRCDILVDDVINSHWNAEALGEAHEFLVELQRTLNK